MRSFVPIALSLLSAVAVASETEAAPDVDSHVHSLKKDTFNDFINGHDLVMAEFFAPWCGHCKALAPEYEVAATELKEKNIPLVKVDCTEENDLCKEHGVEGFPTLKVFRGLESVRPYPGARKSAAIISYMVKQSLPAVSPVTAENLEEFKTMDKIVLVAYTSTDDKAVNDLFTSIADTQRDNYLFGITDDAALATAEEVKQPSIVLYKDFDEKKAVYGGELNEEDLLKWLKVSGTPLVGEVNPETYASYMSAGLPLAYILAGTPEEREKFAADFKPIAEKHRGEISFATLDTQLFGAHASNLNLEPEKFPAFAIHDTAKNAKFPWDQSKELDVDEIAKYVQDVLSGKVKPSIKSEPIPESQTGPVTVVVAHTYNEIVIDNDKDVLIEFYAPWCGHCKALAPKYEELGKLYADNPEFASKVTIAKVDATSNDVPDEIQGFPTIKLFPAGKKDSPITYSGDRSAEALANFVKEQGTYKVDAWVPPPPPAEESPETTAPVTATETASEAPGSSTEEPQTHDEL